MQDRSIQQYYLNAMGLPQWCLKDTEIKDECFYFPSGLCDLNTALATDVCIEDLPLETEFIDNASNIASIESENSAIAAVSEESVVTIAEVSVVKEESDENIFLEAEIPVYQQQPFYQEIEDRVVTQIEINNNRPIQPLFESIATEISSCKLCTTRIFGQQSLKIQLLQKSINSSKNILLLVESPSIEEYQQGRFISGHYSSLIHSIFRAVNLDVNIYVSSILKCLQSDPYHVDDKETFDQQVNNCTAFLKQEIESVKADLIVTLGPIALNYLAETLQENISLEMSIGQVFKLKQSFFNEKDVAIMTTFHPAFLYRNPLFKAKALQHWIEIAAIIG